MFSKEKIREVAQDIADHLQLVEHVKALQDGQKAIIEAMNALADRMKEIELKYPAVSAEIRLDALKETQAVVNAVQGQFNQRLENLAVDVAVMKAGKSSHAYNGFDVMPDQVQHHASKSIALPPGDHP